MVRATSPVIVPASTFQTSIRPSQPAKVVPSNNAHRQGGAAAGDWLPARPWRRHDRGAVTSIVAAPAAVSANMRHDMMLTTSSFVTRPISTHSATKMLP